MCGTTEDGLQVVIETRVPRGDFRSPNCRISEYFVQSTTCLLVSSLFIGQEVSGFLARSAERASAERNSRPEGYTSGSDGSMGGSASKSKPSETPAAAAAGGARTRRAASAQAQVTSKDKAILDLKNARDRLRKYQIRLDIEATQLHESAKRLLLADRRVRPPRSLRRCVWR
jgi:hypothetical protein